MWSIVGGGPAGLYAGARLAAAGFQTTLLEEHAAVGEPVHCTGVLAAEAFDEFNLSRRSLLNQLTTARFWSPAGQSSELFRAAVSKPSSSIAARSIRICLRRATSAGRGHRATARARSARADRRRRRDRQNRRRRRSRARGDPGVRRQLLAAPAGRASACRGCSCTPRSSSCRPRHLGDVELHFGSEIAPKGFGWVVPVVAARRAMRARRRHVRRATRRGISSASPHASATGGASTSGDLGRPRQKILPLAPHLAHLRRSAARDRRCGGSREADDRRRHLLQPRQRRACGRRAGRCAVAERSQRATARAVRAALARAAVGGIPGADSSCACSHIA